MTETEQPTRRFPILAEIMTLPVLLPFTTPFLETVAIFLLEDDHVMPFGLPVNFNFLVFPFSNNRELAEIFTGFIETFI